MIETIKKLIKLLKEEDIDEIEVRRFFTTIRVSRRRVQASEGYGEVGANGTGDIRPGPDVEKLSSGREEMGGDKVVPIASEGNSQSEEDGDLITVRSPMVGTFYRSRSPEAEPFVYEGKEVKVGEVLCIIEAMKLMNEIESETNGIVEKILVEDSQPVEYGQPLFLIKSA